MNSHTSHKNSKKNNNNYYAYPDQNQLMYIPAQYYDEYMNSSSNYDLTAPQQLQQQYQAKHPNGKKGNSSKSQYQYASMHNMNYNYNYSNEETQYNNKKNTQKSNKGQHSSSFKGTSSYSLASKMNYSNMSSAKGVKIYMDGACLFDKFSCKEVSPTEELFILSSCSSHGSNSNSSVNSSASVSSSEEEKNTSSSRKYFATFSIFDGPDPSILIPPTFQFQ